MGFYATDSCPNGSRSAAYDHSVRQASRLRARRHAPSEAICLFWQLSVSGYRFYSPECGRWTARDPLEHRPSNHVSVRGIDGINKVDVLGLEVFDQRQPGKVYVDQTILGQRTQSEEQTRREVLRDYPQEGPEFIEREVRRRLSNDAMYSVLVRILTAIERIRSHHSPPRITVKTRYASAGRDLRGQQVPTIVESIRDGMMFQDKKCEHGIFIGHGFAENGQPHGGAVEAVDLWNRLVPEPQVIWQRSKFAFFACHGRLYNDLYWRMGYGYHGLSQVGDAVNIDFARDIPQWVETRFEVALLQNQISRGCCDKVKIVLYIGEDKEVRREPRPGQ